MPKAFAQGIADPALYFSPLVPHTGIAETNMQVCMLCHGAPAHSELQEKTFDMDESFTATKDCVYCTSALDLSACSANLK